MTVKEKMHAGELYLPFDEELMKEQTLCLDRLYDFNHTRPTETGKRNAMLKEMFWRSAIPAAFCASLMNATENITLRTGRLITLRYETNKLVISLALFCVLRLGYNQQKSKIVIFAENARKSVIYELFLFVHTDIIIT